MSSNIRNMGDTSNESTPSSQAHVSSNPPPNWGPRISGMRLVGTGLYVATTKPASGWTLPPVPAKR
jgi:hypothetical protein